MFFEQSIQLLLLRLALALGSIDMFPLPNMFCCSCVLIYPVLVRLNVGLMSCRDTRTGLS